jgi:hypothetical protein
MKRAPDNVRYLGRVTNAPSEYDGAELYEMKEGPSRPAVSACR